MKKGKSKIQIRNSTAEFLIFTRQAGEDGIEVRVEDETVWLTQKLMAALFEVTVPTINEHLANLYSQGEIVKGSTIRNFRTVQKEGRRKSVVRNFRTTVADERQLSGNPGLFESDFDRHIKKALEGGNEEA
jgi:hypothetical protein